MSVKTTVKVADSKMCHVCGWLYKSSMAGCTTLGMLMDVLVMLVQRAHFLQDLSDLEWSLSHLFLADVSSQSLDFLWDFLCSEPWELDSLA